MICVVVRLGERTTFFRIMLILADLSLSAAQVVPHLQDAADSITLMVQIDDGNALESMWISEAGSHRTLWLGNPSIKSICAAVFSGSETVNCRE
ncbi:MAG: hypothetical protein ACK58L_19885 [Planctomycetota bacterium]